MGIARAKGVVRGIFAVSCLAFAFVLTGCVVHLEAAPGVRAAATVFPSRPCCGLGKVPVERSDERFADERTATITLSTNVWCDVFVDDRPFGRVDRNRVIPIPPGAHTIVCDQGLGMGRWEEHIMIAANEHRRLHGVVLRPVAVCVGLGRGEAVWFGGTYYPNGSCLVRQPGRYRLEVVSRGRRSGAVWLSIPRVGECTLRDEPALDCYPRRRVEM